MRELCRDLLIDSGFFHYLVVANALCRIPFPLVYFVVVVVPQILYVCNPPITCLASSIMINRSIPAVYVFTDTTFLHIFICLSMLIFFLVSGILNKYHIRNRRGNDFSHNLLSLLVLDPTHWLPSNMAASCLTDTILYKKNI